MKYEDALKLWGAQKLTAMVNDQTGYVPRERYQYNTVTQQFDFIERTVDPATVKVEMEFDPGYSYSEYTAQDPKTDLVISGTDNEGDFRRLEIPAKEFDFATVLGEIVAVADGTVTS